MAQSQTKPQGDDGSESVAGVFLGLGPELTRYESASIVIQPVPFDLTSSYQSGSDRGPAAIIEASRHLELFDIETSSEVYTLGIHTAPAIAAKTSAEMIEQTRDCISQFLKSNKFVVTLGGEHAISLAPVTAHADFFGPIGVLQLDAHADLRDTYADDPLSHACVMARILEVKQVERITAVGIRSMSSSELTRQARLTTFFDHEISGGSAWCERVVESLPERVYLTIDLDVFSPALVPSTGTPEPGGLDWRQVITLIDTLCAKRVLVGFDVVELCPGPQIASDFLAAKLVYRILSRRFGREASSKSATGNRN